LTQDPCAVSQIRLLAAERCVIRMNESAHLEPSETSANL
jgi:hypothetical protein